MKLKSAISAISVFLAVIAYDLSVGQQLQGGTQSDRTLHYSRHESVEYEWDYFKINVNFTRATTGSKWIMTVQDSVNVLDQSFRDGGREWNLSASRGRLEQCSYIIDRSLSEFLSEHPDAKLASAHIEMQIITEFWNEILIGVKQKLGHVSGVKQLTLDAPDEVNDEIRQILAKSEVTDAIKSLLKKHGMLTQSVSQSTEILFKDSLAGKKWSYIGGLPDAGILTPGTIEFDVTN